MDSKIRKELSKLGLSKGQSEIYNLLLQNHSLRISDICTALSTPRSTVYEHLKKLFELGLAERVVEGSYKTIQPYPINALRHNLEKEITKLSGLKDSIKKIEKMLPVSNKTKKSGSTTVRYYKGVAGARQIFWNSLKAKNTVYVYSSWGRSRYLGVNFYENFVAESKSRNIQESVLINPSKSALESIEKNLGTSLSRTKMQNLRAIEKNKVKIQGDILIYNNIYAVVYLKEEEITGLEIESEHFANTQRSIFETLWKSAKPLALY